MLEVTDGSVHCKKFSVESGVPGLRRGELSSEEGEGLSGTMENLFKDGAYDDVTGISGKHWGKTRRWKLETCCKRKGVFSGDEGSCLGGAQVSVLGSSARAV